MFRQLLIPIFIELALGATSKIDTNLQDVLNTRGNANIAVSFRESTNTVLERIDSMRFQNRAHKITAMKEQLEQLAESSQKDLILLLNTRSVSYESFWINNRVFVQNADLSLVNAIAAVPNVIQIREQITITLDKPIFEEDPGINAEWGVVKIQAEEAWALPGGNNGAGVVVSTIGTGARYTHQALQNNFRAEYGWYDPYDKTGTPIDLNGIGTHTMGNIVGSGGIGVAPGAQWIACRGCSNIICTEPAMTGCGQWTTCPTKPDGSDADCSLAPQVSSNSWGSGQDDEWFAEIIESWHTVGIIPVFSLGLSLESRCGTVSSPADRLNVIGVGATSSNDTIAAISGRGPAVSGAIKPDIVAPGQNIRSAWGSSDTALNTMTGTSHSTPFVSGVVALLMAHNGNLTFTQIKSLIEDNATRTGLGEVPACGGIPNDQFPNNVYGHGRLNALNALSAAINGSKYFSAHSSVEGNPVFFKEAF